MTNIPTSIRQEGLRNHLGDERYSELVKRVHLNEPKTIIARALGVNRKTVDKWLDIYTEELDK